MTFVKGEGMGEEINQEAVDAPKTKSHQVVAEDFEFEIRKAINKQSMENYLDMPDFIISEIMCSAFWAAVKAKQENVRYLAG